MDDKSAKAAGASASAIRRRPPSLVVGIGASAGGLAAFRSFFDRMPADTGMAFVLVQHLDPDHKSMLGELLRPHTAMHVVDAQDQALLAANQIHVIPPNATLTFEGDMLRVTVPAPAREYRRPIDTVFASLAESQEDCAVGIILSGVGSDGSLGIKAIKEHGGFTLAQAEFDETAMMGMPRSAAATGLVDHVASVEMLPAKLLEHQAHLAKVEERKGADGAREDVRESLAAITTALRKRLKHDFSGYKQNTMVRRIQRRLQVLQIEAVSAYAEHLRREHRREPYRYRNYDFRNRHRSPCDCVCAGRPFSQDGRHFIRTAATLVCEGRRGLPSDPSHPRHVRVFRTQSDQRPAIFQD
jgi:two-component system, chemotaxis family, CheB/CheR fusion protein